MRGPRGDHEDVVAWLSLRLSDVPLRPQVGTEKLLLRRYRGGSRALVPLEEVYELELRPRLPDLLGEEARDLIGRQRLPSDHLHQRDVETVFSRGRAVASPDQLGADQGMARGEVELVVVGLVEVLEGLGDGLGLGPLRELGTQHGELVAEGVGHRAEHDAGGDALQVAVHEVRPHA